MDSFTISTNGILPSTNLNSYNDLLKSLKTSPEVSPNGKKAKIPSESATGRELRKGYIGLKMLDFYNGIRRRSCLVQSIGDTVVRVISVIWKIITYTDLGKVADDLLAIGVRQFNVAAMKISSPVPWIRESLSRTKKRITRGLIRYFPPFVLARWSLDLTFATLCFVCAFLRDMYRVIDEHKRDVFSCQEVMNGTSTTRPGPAQMVRTREVHKIAYYPEHPFEEADGSPTRPRNTHDADRAMSLIVEPCPFCERFALSNEIIARDCSCKIFDVPPLTVPRVEPPTQSEQDESARSKNEMAEDGDIHSMDNRNLAEYLERFKKDHNYITVVLEEGCSMLRSIAKVILFTQSVFLTLAICCLAYLREKVYGFLGGFDPETPEDCKERQEMFDLLVGDPYLYKKPKPLHPDEWYVDVVINTYLGSIMKWMVIGRIIGLFVSRPINIFGTISAFIEAMYLSVLYARDEMGNYLIEDDFTYGVDKDPDYNETDNDDDDADPSQDEPQNNAKSPQNKTPTSKSIVAGKNASPTKGPPANTPEKKDASGRSTNRTRESSLQASSTPKANSRHTGKRGEGTPTKMETNDGTQTVSAIDEQGPILLAPLSPEKLKQVKTRDPIQAAVIRMKGDEIIEFKKKMKERKQGQKSKTKKKVIKNKSGYEVIYESQENIQPCMGLYNALKISCEQFVAGTQSGTLQEYGERSQQNDPETYTAMTEHYQSIEIDDSYVNAYEQDNNSEILVVVSPPACDEIIAPPESDVFDADASTSPKDTGQKGIFDSPRYSSLKDFPKTLNPQDTSDSPKDGDLKKVNKSPKYTFCQPIKPTEDLHELFENVGLQIDADYQAIELSDIDDSTTTLGCEKELSKCSTSTEIMSDYSTTKSKDDSPLSLEMTTTTKSPLSPKMKELLEAEDGMRSSSVDTGHTIAGNLKVLIALASQK